MKTLLRPALTLFCLLSILTGVVYPVIVTGIAQVFFADAAHGSLIVRDKVVVGSRLIGQSFSDPKFFWGRPSATGGWANNALASGGSNQGPLNPALLDAVKVRIATLRAADPAQHDPIPVELVSTSGSGLDPEISPAAARYQASRVARLRGLDREALEGLIKAHTRSRDWGFLGEHRVNVLELNLALEALAAK